MRLKVRARMKTYAVRRIVHRVLGAFEKGDDRQNEKYNEQHFRDSGRSGGDTAKAQYRRDDGNYKKDDCVVQHGKSLRVLFACDFPCAEFGSLRNRVP